jgi:L-ascorbate metabolism protein UlaG (beta-lactamase superfamily)
VPLLPRALLAIAVLSAPAPTFVTLRDQDGRFVNPAGEPPASLGTVLRWSVWDRITGKRRSSPDRADVPFTRADAALLATPPGRGEPARVTWLGHASFLVQLDGVSLLVDPALRPTIFPRIARNVPPGLPLDALPAIDAALVSHNHYDHLDLGTLEAVRAPVVAGLGLKEFLEDEDLSATELAWWGSTDVKGVRVTFVPAHHWSRRGAFDTNETLWGGFVIEGSTATIYHSGDTAYFPGFRVIGERFPGIDLALLPVGAYDPGWFMLKQHMDPEQALRAFLDLGARTFVAMHWGTFKLADEPLDEPPRRVEAERARLGLDPARVRVPAVGETLTVWRDAAVDGRALTAPR